MMNETDTKKAIDILNKVMELELAGVVRYSHYSLMVYENPGQIPVASNISVN